MSKNIKKILLNIFVQYCATLPTLVITKKTRTVSLGLIKELLYSFNSRRYSLVFDGVRL